MNKQKNVRLLFFLKISSFLKWRDRKDKRVLGSLQVHHVSILVCLVVLLVIVPLSASTPYMFPPTDIINALTVPKDKDLYVHLPV